MKHVLSEFVLLRAFPFDKVLYFRGNGKFSCFLIGNIAQKMKFYIKDFFKESLMENFTFCAV